MKTSSILSEHIHVEQRFFPSPPQVFADIYTGWSRKMKGEVAKVVHWGNFGCVNPHAFAAVSVIPPSWREWSKLSCSKYVEFSLSEWLICISLYTLFTRMVQVNQSAQTKNIMDTAHPMGVASHPIHPIHPPTPPDQPLVYPLDQSEYVSLWTANCLSNPPLSQACTMGLAGLNPARAS